MFHLYPFIYTVHDIPFGSCWSHLKPAHKRSRCYSKSSRKILYMPRWRFMTFRCISYLDLLASSGKHIWGNHCDHHRQRWISLVCKSLGWEIDIFIYIYSYVIIFHNWAGTVAPSRPHLSIQWIIMDENRSLLRRFGDHHKRNSLPFTNFTLW